MKKICENCGIEYNADKSVQKYCSYQCAYTMNSALKRKSWQEILDYYDEHSKSGMTYLDMAKEIGCSASKVQKVCQASGRTKPLTSQQSKIVNLYKSGKTINEISSIISKDKKTIKNTLQKLGMYDRSNYDKVEKECLKCGKTFTIPKYSNKKYCSEKCQRSLLHKVNDVKRRSRKNNAIVDLDITVEKLIIKDGPNCKLCGGLIDWDDIVFINDKKHAIGKYPSIDHIIPLSKGGKHAWNNVQLAHFSCNSSKGARYE